MPEFIYRNEKTKEISFPLGGIGTGCIGLAGDGRLIDWEIANRPNKRSINGFSHFAIKTEENGKVIDARVLNGDLAPPYSGDLNASNYRSFGFGPQRGSMAGIPHFESVEFQGEFPIAGLKFLDDTFPGTVSMTAFNPFIPLADKDSSIPAAFFELKVGNTTPTSLRYTVALSLGNPFPAGTGVNKNLEKGNLRMLRLESTKYDAADPEYGDLCVATDGETAHAQEYWYRGRWFDSLEIYWREFSSAGDLPARTYPEPADSNKQYPGTSDTGTLGVRFEIEPAGAKTVRFVVAWNYPNSTNYWNPEDCDCSADGCGETSNLRTWKNYYATQFEDSTDSAAYGLQNWDRLLGETLKFKDALFATTLPAAALEAVSANLAILKTPTTLRLTDGSFYGFEGCHTDSGCCEGSCTHVWNYAYALPFLFPKLERSMRDLDFRFNQRPDGGMAFRLQLPLGREPSKFRPCADGQFGGVIKTYRDWKLSGDTEWLKSNWQAVKKSIEFAWAESNEDRWDLNRDGVLGGRQHHTLDMELFGPNSWLTGFYLGALKAGAEMAEFLGERETAEDYVALFEKGRAWVDEHLFNGAYYHQVVDIADRSILEKYAAGDRRGQSLHGDDIFSAYWNEEAEEIKYQIAEGSGIDQVNAQWHANLCGLGDIFDPAQRKTALRSLFRNNYKSNMRHFFNPCRLYSLNDEGGLVICDWPEGKYRPVVPLPYSGETQNGYEYQAAILMIQEGLVEEGMTVVRGIRDRYDGEKRNPWNEIECGSNYARSMASYSLIPTFSGFSYDMVRGRVGFDPIITENTDVQKGGYRGLEAKAGSAEESYSTFWSLDSGWGLFEINSRGAVLSVLHGSLTLKNLGLPKSFVHTGNGMEVTLRYATDAAMENVTLDFAAKESEQGIYAVCLAVPVTVGEGDALIVENSSRPA